MGCQALRIPGLTITRLKSKTLTENCCAENDTYAVDDTKTEPESWNLVGSQSVIYANDRVSINSYLNVFNYLYQMFWDPNFELALIKGISV